MTVDPKEILAQIRSEARPLMRIHTGAIESMRTEQHPLVERANDYVEDWLQDPDNNTQEDISPTELEKGLVEVGQWCHERGWAHTENDAEAWELLRRVLMAQAKAGEKGAADLLPHMLVSDGFNAFGWQGKWYHHGCQSLDIEEKYAASLCATKVAPSELEHVRLPWPCFVVRVPKFLQALKINGESLRLIVVNQFQFKGTTTVSGKQNIDAAEFDYVSYNLHLITANKYRVLPAHSLAQWAEPSTAKSYDEFRLVEVEHTEIDRRQLEVIGRLVLGALISMNDPKVHRRYGTLPDDKKPSLGSPRYGTSNQVVLHKIGRPVKVDARETITAYATGQKGRVTSVRTLVAGHWKNQPYGPKNSLRRWQHVECYWRGDEDAPRIIRPHVLSSGG